MLIVWDLFVGHDRSLVNTVSLETTVLARLRVSVMSVWRPVSVVAIVLERAHTAITIWVATVFPYSTFPASYCRAITALLDSLLAFQLAFLFF